MKTELLLALGIPCAYLLISTALLLSRHKTLPPFLLRLSTHRAITRNTMVGVESVMEPPSFTLLHQA